MTKSGKRRPPLKIRTHPASNADDIGYGKPPRAHQFEPGKSGNPKGRPKGAKSADTILHELLQQRINLNERGKTRGITILEAILRRIAEDCLKGNIKSAAFVLNRLQAMSSDETDESGLNEDEQTVLETYLKKVQSSLDPEKDDLA
jgi:hypothetical protein